MTVTVTVTVAVTVTVKGQATPVHVLPKNLGRDRVNVGVMATQIPT